MKDCGSKFIKYLLIAFNGLFMIFGIILIATACADMSKIQGFAAMEATGYETDAVLIAVGVLIIVVAAFGCFAAWKESPKLLHIFVGCLILIILLELSVSIAAAALRPKFESSMKSNLRASFIKNKSTREEDSFYMDFWDRIQSNLQCCGVTGPGNYRATNPVINPSYSCCPPDGSDKAVEIKRADCLIAQSYYKDGCEEKVLTTINTTGKTVFVCGILFCFLEVIGVVLALWLARYIKRKGRAEIPLGKLHN